MKLSDGLMRAYCTIIFMVFFFMFCINFSIISSILKGYDETHTQLGEYSVLFSVSPTCPPPALAKRNMVTDFLETNMRLRNGNEPT